MKYDWNDRWNCHWCAQNDNKWDWDTDGIQAQIYNVGFPSKFCSKDCLHKYYERNNIDKSTELKFRPIYLISEVENEKEFGDWESKEVHDI